MKTGEKIKMLRVKHHLTQEELGKRVGVQRAAVNKVEKGAVKLNTEKLARYGEALNIDPSRLLDDDIPFGIYGGEDGIYFSFEVATVVDEIAAKAEKLRPSYQQMILHTIDEFLKLQEETEE